MEYGLVVTLFFPLHVALSWAFFPRDDHTSSKEATTGVLNLRSLTIFLPYTFMKESDCDQRLKHWLSKSVSGTRWILSVITITTNEYGDFLMPSVLAQQLVAKTSLMVSPTKYCNIFLAFSRCATSTADVTSTRIMDLSFSLLSVVIGESVLLECLRIRSSLIPASLSSWAFLSNIDAHAFRSTASAAEMMWWRVVVSSRYITVQKDALSAQKVYSGS